MLRAMTERASNVGSPRVQEAVAGRLEEWLTGSVAESEGVRYVGQEMIEISRVWRLMINAALSSFPV